ncbi:MAG: PQQ-binding-like beta-propeller repeat protein, partial [Longimicrobiales bacterium]
PGSYFVGTAGNGLMQLDAHTFSSKRLPFGLNARGAGAIAYWHDRLWFGGDARSINGSLVSATAQLDRFTEHAPQSGAPADLITALATTDSALYAGTTHGLYVLAGAQGRERWRTGRFGGSDVVTSLVASDGYIYVGTDRGASRIDRAGAYDAILSGPYVYGIDATPDTVWIASGAGLIAFARTGGAPAMALRGGGSPPAPVMDVRIVGDTLYALTMDALYRRGPGGWLVPDRQPSQRLGLLGRLRSDGSSLWVLGTAGFAVKRAKATTWTYYSVSDDVPEGPVRDLLPLGLTQWLATPAGALRVPLER